MDVSYTAAMSVLHLVVDSMLVMLSQSVQIPDSRQSALMETDDSTDFKRNFFFLSGDLYKGYLPGLSNATISVLLNFPDHPEVPEQEATRKITDFYLVTVIHEDGCGGPLLRGANEMVGNVELRAPGRPHESGRINLEVMARLPDQVLFAFQTNITITL
ncbi:hypothetical protein BDV95DRAFT_665296 [Massariosphaeria phaeospora]|uniref:Uncharacterized protein n=1 Tax=Massariosphaeria phaeospora TaxID=100035 RepID=A0A7C8IC40_9PLEO|nr:hypothetical protein BDV95DRAFT_665296 [Massariosphaeria phaeospora]